MALVQNPAGQGSQIVEQFTYDALGRRIASVDYDYDASSNDLTRHFYYDGDNVIAEYEGTSGSPSLARHFVNGSSYIDERAVMHDVTNDADYYYTLRDLYSVEGLVNNRGHEVEWYTYDAYGLSVIKGIENNDVDYDGDSDSGDDAAIFRRLGQNPCVAGTIYDTNGDGQISSGDYWGLPSSPSIVEIPESSYGNRYAFTGRSLDPIDYNTNGVPTFKFYDNRWREYDPRHGRFMQRDLLEYVDGMNLYEYVKSRPTGAVDPSGRVVVLIHGVATEADWFDRAESGFKRYWKDNAQCEQAVIRFNWGDSHTWWGLSGKQGGHAPYASDDIKDMYSEGSGILPDRRYMRDSVRRMKSVLDQLNKVAAETGGCEPITVVAHSQGAIIALGSLQMGGRLDNLIMMGSPLDVFPAGDFTGYDGDLKPDPGRVRGEIYNYWSKGDGAAWWKGGIGAHGDEVAESGAFPWITNREFGPGLEVNGFILPPGDGEYDHSDYMGSEDIFYGVQAKDLARGGGNCTSRDARIAEIQDLAARWR